MKQNLILPIIAITLLLASCKKNQETSTAPTLEVYADSLFQTSIDSAQIAGASILIFHKDKILLNKSYGFASLELSTPMPTDGIFDIGSVTKQFTAAAILKLVEAEKLSLDDDFTDYLEFDTKGRKITIAQLLDHTSGLAKAPNGKDEFTQMSFDEFPHRLTVQLVAPKEFLHEPGEALIYNNVAFVFLGLIIEKVTGQTYEDYLKETFFDPLGMSSTSFGSNTTVVKNKVNGYNYDPNGLQKMSFLNYYIPYSAGSFVSSSEYLLIWTRALHNGKVLSEPMYQSMVSPGKLNDGTTVRYAKGLANFSNYGHKEISHGGAIAGFSSFVQYYPEVDLYIITLVNTIGPKKTGRFFGYETAWELLDKQEYEQATLDFDTIDIQGTYIGQTRGGRDTDGKQSIEINSIKNGITRQVMGEEKIDTLKVYVGSNTWMDGNDKITIENNEYRVDKIYNYYILKKEK
ncbi:beta-lactamase family protein [Nonlabens sp. Ci31]|uniref:serine hydrolase domain-containing protein n=1 Tax=Nonlabens sp. Ci31 TaxID=2608253 RepID=UPI001463261F|nr:serine hydrolase domain-containing protein [Nonlabens sp. Ci31]QJP34678.1 beta-lactamase family protein [Nonlabens sp. Ci31]